MKKGPNYKTTDSPERSEWLWFVENHPRGNIFQTPYMFDVYKSTPFNDAGVIYMQDELGNVLGILVYYMLKELGIKGYFSTRALIVGGPLAKDNNPDFIEAILEIYNQKAKRHQVIYTEVRNLFDMKDLKTAFMHKGFEYQEHLTIHMNLTKTEEELTDALHRGRGSNIKRAVKKGVITKDIDANKEMNEAHQLIKTTYERINLPCPHIELFTNTQKFLGPHVKFFGAYIEGKLVGVRVYLLFKDMVYDWYAAGDRDYSGFHANDLLPWNGMLWAKESMYKIYDFAGAGKPNEDYSVRDYKMKFGGNLLEFGRYLSVHKPILYKVGVLGLKVYRKLN